MEKLKSEKEKKIIFILISTFLISLIILHSMMSYKNNKEIDQFLKNSTQQQEKIYNAIYDEFTTLTDVTYKAQIKKRICPQTLYKVKHKLEDETKLRKSLYKNCLQNFESLKGYKLKQLHFHTSKGESFLRMNEPDAFGDDLTRTRPMISQMVKTKKFITGYEEGKRTGGYRYIYPIYYNNEYVGSVEYVFSSLIISKRFMDNYGGRANFLINEKVLDKYKMDPDEKGYIRSHLDGFYIEKQFFKTMKEKQLSKNTLDKIRHESKNKEKFSIYDKKTKKIITVLKIKDQALKETEGLFIIRSDAPYIYNKNRNFMFMFSIFTFFILIIHYFLYLHLMSKVLLEIKIDEAIFETRQKDKRILKNEKLAAMGEMIDSIAHQWKQPVSVIKMCLDMIELDMMQGHLDKKYITKNIETSNLQIDHLVKTIDEFRDFFKPNESVELFELKTLVQKALLLVKDELIKNSITYTLNIEDEPHININKNSFIHVLINLINNAKDAFNENNISNREIKISAFKDQDQIVLKVCDNAGGIKESIIDRVFESRFTTKDHIKGTGIGLYMSKQILEKYNGSIEVYNSKQGACFKIVF